MIKLAELPPTERRQRAHAALADAIELVAALATLTDDYAVWQSARAAQTNIRKALRALNDAAVGA